MNSQMTHQERVEAALANIRAFRLPLENLTVKVDDIYQGIEEREVDQVVLDVPEPWRVVASAAEALAPGGMFQLCAHGVAGAPAPGGAPGAPGV